MKTRDRNNKQIASLLVCYAEKRGPLFNPVGGRAMNSFSAAFWAGFDGQEKGCHNPNDRSYRGSQAYVMYRAGKAAKLNTNHSRSIDLLQQPRRTT